MILWTIKLFRTVRQAIAGRKHPAQLAWAVAFGCLLGIIPHGNLLAVAVLLVVMSLRVNHAMAALTTIGVTFGATRLDPLSHQVGEFLLTKPEWSQIASKIWALPMMPWTDLNNTVVLGSFAIGLAALVPLFLITYPVFRLFASSAEADEVDDELVETAPVHNQDQRASEQFIRVDQGSSATPASGPAITVDQYDRRATQSAEKIQFQEVPPPTTTHHLETKIDVIRMREPNPSVPYAQRSNQRAESHADSPDHQPMDEALNYLLRQLRDSQQRNAA